MIINRQVERASDMPERELQADMPIYFPNAMVIIIIMINKL